MPPLMLWHPPPASQNRHAAPPDPTGGWHGPGSDGPGPELGEVICIGADEDDSDVCVCVCVREGGLGGDAEQARLEVAAMHGREVSVGAGLSIWGQEEDERREGQEREREGKD
jgi:hypothetical protein